LGIEPNLTNIMILFGMSILRPKALQIREKKHEVYLLAYKLIRLMMADTAPESAISPLQLRFCHATARILAILDSTHSVDKRAIRPHCHAFGL